MKKVNPYQGFPNTDPTIYIFSQSNQQPWIGSNLNSILPPAVLTLNLNFVIHLRHMKRYKLMLLHSASKNDKAILNLHHSLKKSV